jgi:hypothetical protein
MSLDSYGDLPQRMSNIRNQMNKELEAIRSNQSLTAVGRKAAAARVVLNAKKEAGHLREQHITTRKARRDTLRRSLFGLPEGASATEVAIWRDAQDRASRLDKEEDAAKLIERSRSAGDESMVRAIAERAVERGWTGVIDTFRTPDDPGEMTAKVLTLQALCDIPDGPLTNIADNALFALSQPTELSGHTAADLAKLAEAKPDELVPTTPWWHD